MSDTHNHAICAQKAYEALKREDAKNIIARYPSFYGAGAQGGDYYLYYNVLSNDKWTNELSECLHADINDLIFAFAQNINKTQSPDDKEKKTAYLFGFITHHALDNQTHPFIDSSFNETENHKKTEVQLDVAYAKYAESVLKTTVAEMMTKDDCALIQLMHESVFFMKLKQTLPEGMFYKCVENYQKIIPLISNKLLLPVARMLKGSGFGFKFSDAFFIQDEKIPVRKRLNLNNDKWTNPINEFEIYDMSYPQLMNYAVKDSASRIEKTFECLNRNAPVEAYARIFENKSFYY